MHDVYHTYDPMHANKSSRSARSIRSDMLHASPSSRYSASLQFNLPIIVAPALSHQTLPFEFFAPCTTLSNRRSTETPRNSVMTAYTST